MQSGNRESRHEDGDSRIHCGAYERFPAIEVSVQGGGHDPGSIGYASHRDRGPTLRTHDVERGREDLVAARLSDYQGNHGYFRNLGFRFSR